MKYFKTLLFISLLFLTFIGKSQNPAIDSLMKVVLKASEDTVKIDALLKLSDITYDDPEKQYSYLTKALKLAEESDYKRGIASSYSSLGVYYTSLGDFNSALKYLRMSSELFGELNYKDYQVATLGNMGNVYCYQGDFEKGLKCFLDALEVMYEVGDKNWIATAKNNIGSVYTYLDEDSVALKYYSEAYEIYQEINDEKGMSLALGNLGNVYNKQKKHNLAIEHYEKAVELDVKNSNMQQLGMNYTNLGTAYGDIGDNENAIKYFEEAVVVFEYLGNKNGLSVTYLTLSYFYRNINNHSKAKEYLRKSLEISNEIGSKHTLMKVYQELAVHDSIDGNYLSAYQNFKKYSNLKDSIYQTEKSQQITEMQTKFDTERKEKENELLKEKNVRNELINERKNILIFAIAGILIIMILFGINIIRTSRIRKRINSELKDKNFEINQQKEEIETQNEILHQQNDKIEKSHKKITDSINYASRIQEAMLPAKLVIDQFLPENFIFFKPRDVVSGDFYWIKEVKNHLLIVAADSTGHGVPGAFVSMMGMALLNDVVNIQSIQNASDVLEELRKRVKSSLKQTGAMEEQKDGMDLGMCVINLETEVMQFSGANIPLYHFRNGELIVYKPVSNPIGIAYRELAYEDHEIQLQNDDVFYMFSDGIVDQFHHETNEKFKTSGLNELLTRIHDLPFANQHEEIEKSYIEWTKNEENQTDDILIMGFKIT